MPKLKYSDTTGKSGKGSGCLTIFGLFFLIPGLVIGFFALKNVFSSIQATQWTSVQATILSSDLKVSHGDTTTYRATGRFRYSMNGIEHESTQLFFGGGNDNIGSFHQDLVRELRNNLSRQQTMTAWVNPKNPSEAVLVKNIRWGKFAFMMVFPLIFGGVGIGMLWWARHSGKLAIQVQVLRSHYPEQPWMWREEWQSSTIKSSNKALLWFSIIFAAVWNLISAPVLFMLPGEILDKKNYIAGIALLFPLFGLGLAAWAIRNYRQFKKFGESELTLQDMPVRLGQTLRASLQIPDQLPANTLCKVTLECVHVYESGSGDDRRTREDILWQDEQRLTTPSTAPMIGQALPLVFKLPKLQPVSDWENPVNQHLWRVRVNAEVPGVNFTANFEIPVFASDNPEGVDTEHEEQFFAEMLDDKSHIDHGDWSRLNFSMEQTVEGTRYTFARARLKNMCAVLTVMTLIFGGVGISMFVIKNGSTVIGVAFSLFGFFLGWAALHQWLYRSEITVSYNRLISRSGWFSTKRKEFQLKDVERIYKHSSMSSGSTKYYGIYLDTAEKKKIKLAMNLVGNRDIDSLITKISDELGFKAKT